MASYHIETYGCEANRGESREIERRLRDAGHHRVDGPGSADVAILNTCTVVETTERRMLRRAKELERETADLVVTGCMALAQGGDFREAGVNARVCGWDEVPTAVGNGGRGGQLSTGGLPEEPLEPRTGRRPRQRLDCL